MADGRPENPRNREGRHGRRTRGRAEGVTRLAVETSIAPQSSRSDCVASKTWGNSLSSRPRQHSTGICHAPAQHASLYPSWK